MADVEKIRILVGLNVDRYTVKIIDKANNEIAYDKLTTKAGYSVMLYERS